MTLILLYFYYSRGLTLQSPCLKSNGKAKNGKKKPLNNARLRCDERCAQRN